MENNEYLQKLKESYSKHKDSEIATDIAFIESNGDMKKELELLKYYYEDMHKNKDIEHRINFVKSRIGINEYIEEQKAKGKTEDEILEEIKNILEKIKEGFKEDKL